MLARADSLGIPGLATASPAAFPAWARATSSPESDAEAAFLAGAALFRLDALIRENPAWTGVLAKRLALSAAVASVTRAGRAQDEARLRDAIHLSRPGCDPGPAGRKLLAWRALTERSSGHWRSAVVIAAQILLVPQDEAFQEAVTAAEVCAGGAKLAPFAAARAFGLACRALTPVVGRQSLAGRGGEGELLAAWLADSVLAQKLNWPVALPLLTATLFSSAGRRERGDFDDGAETARILSAYAKAAAGACDLSAELGRRAKKLLEAQPKLRAKGARAALQALLDDDSLSAATNISGLSERGARRLFDRLVELGAVRELTGRATFRLYGL
jgi:Protein of unknown function (DUF1403)